MARHAALLVALLLAALLPATWADGPRSGRRGMERRLQGVVIPKISFDQAQVKEVFQFLKARAQQLDLDSSAPMNLVYQCKPEALNQVVTMELENVPLGEALRYVCMGTGLGYRVEEYAIVISDSTADRARMQTRVFQVDPSMPFASGKASKDKKVTFKGDKE